MHILLLHLIPANRRKLINEGYKLLGSLRVSNADGEDGAPHSPVDPSVAMDVVNFQDNSIHDLI